MPLPIEDYALISDRQSAALVGCDGSIDWLCMPRFDSEAVFAALLGDESNGRWRIAPKGATKAKRRAYRPDTLILETEFETRKGVVRIIDFMPERGEAPDIVRIVEGVHGTVPMQMDLTMRFGYGSVTPWVTREMGALCAIAGPNSMWLRTAVELHGENRSTVADFTVAGGDRVPFVLTWSPSHKKAPREVDPERALKNTEAYWKGWARQCKYRGEYREAVVRSLMTLKALQYGPTGGIIAALTTSLPEQLGGVRNWDYRYCWLRDATLTLEALTDCGYREEAAAWRNWLLRTAAGDPEDLQIMYGLAGERRLEEFEADWLPGYEGAKPVRIGNAAYEQFQLDVYGEVMDALLCARRHGVEADLHGWDLQRMLMDYVEAHWQDPDEGLWEVRGGRRHFVHSKVMAWVAVDRCIKTIEQFGVEGPLKKWRALRNKMHREICEKGFDTKRQTFTMYYGSKEIDAATLLIPVVGFLPPDDERVKGTVAAVERELIDKDGFVQRYTQTKSKADGLPAGEGSFLVCSFWLADNYALAGRDQEARQLFEKLLALRNDVGLLAEEYDSGSGRLVGNFPQAYSHVGLINTARRLSGDAMPMTTAT